MEGNDTFKVRKLAAGCQARSLWAIEIQGIVLVGEKRGVHAPQRIRYSRTKLHLSDDLGLHVDARRYLLQNQAVSLQAEHAALGDV